MGRVLGLLGWPAIFIAVGGLLSVVGALFAARQRAEYERVLRQKAEENAELTRQVAASVTGGDTFAYLQPLPTDSEDSVTLLLTRDGDYPLYDVEVRIGDQARVDELIARYSSGGAGTLKPGFSLRQFYEGQTVLRIGNVGMSQAWTYEGYRLPNREHVNLAVSIQARNGSVSQRLAMRRIGGERKWASIVRRDRDNALLVRMADSGFPVNQSGEIDW
jgi:hypothetical protein